MKASPRVTQAVEGLKGIFRFLKRSGDGLYQRRID
jgi:hypothetical protein